MKDEVIRQAKARNGMREMSKWLDLNHNAVKGVLSLDLERPLTEGDKRALSECIGVMGIALTWMGRYLNEMEGK